MASNIINIKNLYKSFGNNHVLQGVNLTLDKGESLAIIGGSGTGKSVLLKILLGILTSDAGTISMFGRNITGLSESRRLAINNDIGMLFQYSALFDSMTIWENVSFNLLQQGMKRAEAKDIAIDYLKSVGLSDKYCDFYPADISGGMRKRVGLARAIITTPSLLFFDEPTAGLDPIIGHVIDDLIISAVRENKCSALTITHNIESAKRIANKIAFLYDGKILWYGNVSDLDTIDNPYVHQFIHGHIEGPIQLVR